MTSVMVAAAAAEDFGNGRMMPLPERPTLEVKPAFAERQAISNESALANAKLTSSNRTTTTTPSNRRPAWQVRRQPQKAVVILGEAASPLDQAMMRQGSGVAPRGAAAPWPVIILAAGEPVVGQGAKKVEFDETVFKPDPDYEDKPYDRDAQLDIYGGKTAVDTQRPVVELGTPLYDVGPLARAPNSYAPRIRF
jgi:hypothetical protein